MGETLNLVLTDHFLVRLIAPRWNPYGDDSDEDDDIDTFLKLHPDTTIEELIAMIEEITGIPAENQERYLEKDPDDPNIPYVYLNEGLVSDFDFKDKVLCVAVV